MDAQMTRKARTYKEVLVTGILPMTTNAEIREVALAVAGETRESIFGTTIKRFPSTGNATVKIDTD